MLAGIKEIQWIIKINMIALITIGLSTIKPSPKHIEIIIEINNIFFKCIFI
tara:strand:- start:1854 stop:2006 length:153 start_codon:yes stop_codon:yes gene_type:complete